MIQFIRSYIKQRKVSKARRLYKLSDRDVEILSLIAKGYTDKQIADKFFLKTVTISKKNQYIRRKIHALNRAEMVRFAIENNLF